MWSQFIGAAVDTYNGQMNRLSGFLGQRKQYKYNLKLQKQQQQWQEQMWRMQNEYNLPSMEIARLRDAGVNPALAFNNAGASAAPVPQSGSVGGVSAPSFPSSPAIGGQLSANILASQRVQNETAVSESVVDRNEAEANKLNKEADESASRKTLNDIEIKIKNDPAYIAAQQEFPALRNAQARLDKAMTDLRYSFDLETYGNRVMSSNLSVTEQNLRIITSAANFRNVVATYDQIRAYADFLDSGSEENRAAAAKLRQDLDIRAGQALLGTLQRDALRYCHDHGVSDSITGEIRSFTSALADEYAAGVDKNIYSSRAAAVVSEQDRIYQSEHGQERRSLETEEIRRRANLYRTSQWNMSINTGLNFVRTAVDAGAAIMTRGASKAAGNLITPRAGAERMPLSPEASRVLRAVFPDVEKRLTTY